LPAAPGDWNRVRNCRLSRCRQDNLGFNGVAFEQCEVDGLLRAGPMPLYLFSCVFDRVRVQGKVHSIKINPEYSMTGDDATLQIQWDDAIRNFYRDVEWALDISEAEFTSAPTFEAIPGHLIRRDPSRQVLVRRESLEGANFDSTALSGASIALDWFLKRSQFDSIVLVGSCLPTYRQRDLDTLQRLRDAGIADPD